MTFKIHVGRRKRRRCPKCKRVLLNPDRKHRSRPRGGGTWCNGVPPSSEEKRAKDLLIRTHDAMASMAMDGRYQELIALLSPIEKQLPPRGTRGDR